jgi:hypothetical protein
MTEAVLIAIPVHERERLFRFCLSTVAEMVLPEGSQIVVFDDASQNFDVGAVAAEMLPGTETRRSAFRLGADAACYLIWSHFLGSGCSHLLMLDSDLIANRHAVADGLKALQSFDGLLSLYNSRRHPAIAANGDLVLKRRLGNAGTLWTQALVRLVRQDMDAGNCLDDRYSTFLNERGIRLAAFERSRVQHLGHEGLNNQYFGDLEHGVNFRPDGPAQFDAITAIYDDLLSRQALFLPPADTHRVRR